MKVHLDPKLYGIAPRTVLMKKDSEEFILVINRKSRIILKDAIIILKKAETIKGKVTNAIVSLETNAPVCSKSIRLLNENGVAVSIIN